MNRYIIFIKISSSLYFYFLNYYSFSQTISNHILHPIEKKSKYLFYLHGGVVTVLGDNAINQSVPEWGRYEYSNILDSLKSRSFNIISERRFSHISDSVYSLKLSAQIDSLLRAGVSPKNILVIGASAGWNIVLHTSSILKNKKIKYTIMGGCWETTYKEYSPISLYGKFLSVIEKSDPHGTCTKIFETRKNIKHFEEITLHTGLSHGFIYQGYKEWIDPIVKWFYRI